MGEHTTPVQRRTFYERHKQGLSYRDIADQYGVSRECVRYWCRRQRDGGSVETTYRKEPTGILSRFHWLVRYCVLRLRLEHPRWGPERICFHLGKRPSLKGMALPSCAQIGRYLHQWSRFRRAPNRQVPPPRPDPPTEVHQRWQADFKTDIVLQGDTPAHLHTVYDPVGEVCIGTNLFAVDKVVMRTERVPMEQARETLRKCFALWNTLPDEIQTDGEPTLAVRKGDAFPGTFTLWLIGLGIRHLVTRPGKPTDNAEVERCHRTVNDYAIVGNEDHSVPDMRGILDQATFELAFELPSHAEGCAGKPPVQAHPELLHPRRLFRPELELATFDLKRVDAYLSTFTWIRKVGKTGQISLGAQERYSVGRTYARRDVLIRFDPTDRHFAFFLPETPEDEIGRRPARNLEVEDLTGLSSWPVGLVPQQLPMPLIFEEG